MSSPYPANRARPAHHLRAVSAMYVGLLLTVVASIAPYVDRSTGASLAQHIQRGYPAYTHERIDSAVTAWLVILTVVGVLGIASWVGAIWSVNTQQRWAPWAATAILVLGTGLALAALLTKDTSGDVGLTPLLGWIGMLPSVAGAVAVGALWRSRSLP